MTFRGSLFLKGIAMGAADVVPGVSGGTIAFISGIYEELIDSLRSLSLKSFRVLFTDGPKSFWQVVNGTFLLTLGTGILLSIITLARLVSYCLEHYSVWVWSFFFGLIAASVFYIWRQLGKIDRSAIFALLVGIVVATLIALAPRGQIEASPLTVFLAGMVAISAMILPGISGSFILLLMGLYTQMMKAISQFDLPLVMAFSAGCLVGLMAFSRLLSWLLHHHRHRMLSLLTGFLAGSLIVVWPWKAVPEEGKAELSERLLLPWQYYSGTELALTLCTALAMMGLGAALVLMLENLANDAGDSL